MTGNPPDIPRGLGPGEAPRGSRLMFWLLLGLYLAMLTAGLMRHELWRDEAQAWLITRESATLGGLLDWLVVEGHPAAWYLLLWVPARLTSDPAAMQAVHALVAGASAAVVLAAAPFRWRDRALLVLGYYSLYEFGVVSRGYALGVLGVYAALAAYGRWVKTCEAPDLSPSDRRATPGGGWLLVAAAALAVSANTSVYGLMIAGAIGTGLAVDLWRRRKRSAARGSPGPGWRSLAGSGLVWSVGLLVSLVQLGRYATSDLRYGARRDNAGLIVNPYVLPDVTGHFVDALLPLPNGFSASPWSDSLLRHVGWWGQPWVLAGVALVWGVALVTGLRRRPAAAAALVMGVGLMLTFSLAVFRGYFPRHLGHYFVLVVGCLWLYRLAEPAAARWWPAAGDPVADAGARRRAGWAWTVVLAWGAASGVGLWAVDLAEPFSDGPAAARAIRTAAAEGGGGDEVRVVSTMRSVASSLAAPLRREVVFSDTATRGGAVDWRLRVRGFEDVGLAETIRRLDEDADSARGPLFLQVPPGPPPTLPPGYAAESVYPGGPTLSAGESFAIYRLHPPADEPATDEPAR